MKRSDMDMIAQDMVCIAERADGKGKVEGYYFCLHHNDGRTHLHHLIIPLEVDLSRGTPLDQIQVEVVPGSITLKAREPMVMDADEIVLSADPSKWLWVERKGDYCAEAFKAGKTISGLIAFDSETLGAFLYCERPEEYGKTWRCWTSRPTDEQREKVKWDAIG